MKSKLFRVLRHLVGVPGDDDLVRAELLRVGCLAGGRGEENGVSPECVGELDAHVTETAEPDDADFVARTDFPVAQRRVSGDAGAEQRRRACRVELGRDREHESLVYHDLPRVSAVGHPAEDLVGAVVGAAELGVAVLLEPLLTALADTAGIHQAADGGQVADLELGHLVADAGYASDDLVSRYGRIGGTGPLVADRVQVRMAHATIEDVDLHVLRAGRAALEPEGLERRGVALGRVSESREGGWLPRRGLGSRGWFCRRSHAFSLIFIIRWRGLARTARRPGSVAYLHTIPNLVRPK